MYGEKISDERKQVLKRYLTTNDYKAVAERTGISYSTVCNIADARQNLTKRNYKAYVDLVKMCKRRIKSTIKLTKVDSKILDDKPE